MQQRLKEQRAKHRPPEPVVLPHEDEENAYEQEELPPASPHYAGHSAGIHPEDVPHTTNEQVTHSEQQQWYQTTRRVSLAPTLEPEPKPQKGEDVGLYDGRRTNSTTRRYSTEAPRGHAVIERPNFTVDVHRDYVFKAKQRPVREQAAPTGGAGHEQATPRHTEEQHAPRRRFTLHPLAYIGLTMLGCVVLWMLVQQCVSIWMTTSDNLHYGTPRTYQCDAVVGHADSSASPSHFIALNLHDHIEVIEFPGGDATHAKVYLGPVLVAGQEQTPVTLTFKDVNGDGKLDMLIHIGTQTVIFLNTGSAFRPATASDHVSL